MRIVCYCWYYIEKLGFQVIFILMDFRGEFVVQVLLFLIMIIDDYKIFYVVENVLNRQVVVESIVFYFLFFLINVVDRCSLLMFMQLFDQLI